ncbi:phosphatidylinositol phosphatase PTPRQ-like isoform X2 [Littorina saxatilis]|uniref:phosphatidylinositol phosphatase PTPRQ-like isoform X2 n=1 Tax=Littorina saxatilis TaxID=31220 RepID=UPI0038B5ED3D
MERPGVPGHLWVLLLIPIALWLTPPVSGLTSTKSVSPTTTVTKLSSSLSSTITTTMTSSKTTATSTTIPTTPTTPTTTTTTLSTTAAPVAPGEDCDKETPSPPCVSNAFCNDTKMCQCNSTHYEDASNNTCRERQNYTQSCTENKQCFETNNEACVNNSGSTTSMCLCSNIAFRRTNECRLATELEVTSLGLNTTAGYMETSIAVQWNASSDVLTGSMYQATLNESNTTHWGTDTHHTFTELEPGTSLVPGTTYTVTVTTRVPRNPGHTTEDYANETTSPVTVYTKPAVPGPLMESPYPGPEVTIKFNRSNGHVDEYNVSLQTGESKQVISEKDGGVQSVMFSNLTPGAFYNVTIVAVITGPNPNVLSDPYQEEFRVKANSSGKVDNLKVEDAKGSRWLDVSWQKPTNPNGKMTGYLLVAQVSPTGSCASAISVQCTDCSEGMGDIQTQKLKTLNCNTSSNQTTSSTHLNSNTKFTGNLTGLLPDLLYKVQVYPYNEEGEGTVNQIMNTTKEEAAEPLHDVMAVPGGVGQLNVTWIPGVRTGKTNYTVTWEEKYSLTSDQFTLVNSTTITGYDNQMHQINGLLSYWDYRVSVQASAPLGASDNKTTTATTRSSEPGQVQTLQLTPDENDASKLVLTFECPEERERNGNISKFMYNSSTANSEFPNPRKPKGDLTWENDCVFNQTLEVSAETLYTINVYAVTEGNLNGSVSTQTVNISATPPTLTPPTGRKLVEQKGITQREVALEVCPCLVSKEQGTIILAGIIVCVTTNDDDCNKRRSLQGSRVGDASMYGDRQEFPTWKEFKDKGYKGKYRATPDNWHTIIGEGGTIRRRRSLLKRVARTADDFLRYTLGDNSSCEQAKPDVYCNGPLPAGREIKILVFACTRGGCSEVLALEDLRTEAFADDDNTEAIVGGIVAALAVIALVVVAVFMFRRGHDGHSPLKPRAPRVVPKPIKLKDFTAHLNRLNKDSNLLFQEEFEDVQENSPKQYSHEAATLDVNKIKNRYVNILPYDHTRVKLITDDDDDSSDFINANYIPGYTSPREYIATQGPMTGTIVVL